MASYLSDSFMPIFIGALTLGATAPFGFNSISMLANVWFNNKQHATATGLMGIADVIGALATFIIQAIMTYAGFFSGDETPEQIRGQTYTLMIYEGFAIILIDILIIILMREKPEHPPSKLAATEELNESTGVWSEVKILLKNKNFMCLLICYSIIYAILNSTMDAISPIFNPYY